MELVAARAAKTWSPWHLHLKSLFYRLTSSAGGGQAFSGFCVECRKYLKDQAGEAIAVSAAILSLSAFMKDDELKGDTCKEIVLAIFDHMDLSPLKVHFDLRDRPQTIMLDTRNNAGLVLDAFRSSISGDTSHGKLFIEINLSRLAFAISNIISTRYSLSEEADVQSTLSLRRSSWLPADLPKSIVRPFNDLRSEKNKNNWEIIRQFLNYSPHVVVKSRV